MTTETQALRLSIASPGDIETTARLLTQLRDRYLAADEASPNLARRIILSSWERCRKMHVDAGRRRAPLAISRDAQLQELREANEALMRAARPVMVRLAEHLADSGYAVVLTDKAGCILEIAGDKDVRRRLERIDFLPGGDWSESAAGTNAIGTALADGRPVQLMAAEHFCDGWTDLTCTAVPIRYPGTADVFGILDITGDYRLIRAHLISLLAVSVLDVEKRLWMLLHGDARRAGRRARVDDAPRGNGTAVQPPDPITLTLAGGAISASLELDVTMQAVALQTAALLHLEGAAVCLFDAGDAGTPLYRDAWVHGVAEPQLVPFLGESDAATVLRERGEPIIVENLWTSPLFSKTRLPHMATRSIALLPLATASGIIGFVALPRRTEGRWEFDDLGHAFVLMPQAATAIENALLFDAMRQHNKHVEAINAVAQFLGSLNDPHEHVDALLACITDVMGVDAGLLFLHGADDERWTLVGDHGVCAPAVEKLRRSTATRRMAGGTASVADSRHPAVLHELAFSITEVESEYPLRASGCRSALIVPLEDGPTLVGVIELGVRRQRRFRNADVRTLAAIGEQVIMSFKNAQLRRAASELQALRQADRLKNDFLAIVSHDLRSPLTAIRASVDGLIDRDGGSQRPPPLDLLNNVSMQAHRLGRLVDRLLDVSQIEAGGLRLDREWHDLPALLADAAAGIAALYGANRVGCSILADPPLLFVDHDRFIQVLYNLLDNACKYTAAGCPVTVHASWTGTEITIGVADRGTGVRPSERDNIFRPFYRSRGRDDTVKSVGLGLAICRGIVEAHGGRIWVEDNVHGGSTFRFVIPLIAEDGVESHAQDG